MIEDKKIMDLNFINSTSYNEDFRGLRGDFTTRIMRPMKVDQTVKGTKFTSKTCYEEHINKTANKQLSTKGWPRQVQIKNKKQKSTMQMRNQ